MGQNYQYAIELTLKLDNSDPLHHTLLGSFGRLDIGENRVISGNPSIVYPSTAGCLPETSGESGIRPPTKNYKTAPRKPTKGKTKSKCWACRKHFYANRADLIKRVKCPHCDEVNCVIKYVCSKELKGYGSSFYAGRNKYKCWCGKLWTSKNRVLAYRD